MQSFSERCSLKSYILQGLVKTCKRYIEANHFLLLSCSLERFFNYCTRRQCIVFSSLVLLFEGNCLSGGNYFWRKCYGQGPIFLGGNYSWGQMSGGQSSRGSYLGEGVIFFEGNCPRTDKAFIGSFQQKLKFIQHVQL